MRLPILALAAVSTAAPARAQTYFAKPREEPCGQRYQRHRHAS